MLILSDEVQSSQYSSSIQISILPAVIGVPSALTPEDYGSILHRLTTLDDGFPSTNPVICESFSQTAGQILSRLFVKRISN